MTTTLKLAITAIRSGRREEGRQLLNLLIQQNPNNEMAWLWMSSVVDSDEKRARCLYHVLAVNPGNIVARQGLQVLGIVVSDSRPVKVPRDSQPIQIQRPVQKPQTGPLKSLPAPQSPLARISERRPFRIDPETVVSELPFTPARDPFSKSTPLVQNTASPTVVPVVRTPPDTEPLPNPSQPVPMAQHPVVPQGQAAPPPSQPVPVVQPQSPPLPVAPQVQPQTNGVAPGYPISDTGPFAVQQAAVAVQQAAAAQVPSVAQQPQPDPPVVNGGPVTDTRPTHPMATPPELPVTAPQQLQLAGHSGITMGMPTQQPISQPVVPMHAQATMGMPMPVQSQPQFQPQPQPQMSNSLPQQQTNPPLGMSIAGYPAQPLSPPAIHANSTMAMATPAMQPNMMMSNVAYPSAPQPRIKYEEESEEEGMNILAVIVFGSLSVTALGGLGMLILLIFTTG